MNPLSRLSNKNARITALYLHWKAKQGSALVWPKADHVARLVVAGVLAFFTCLYALPESEATVWIKTTLLYWTLTGIGGCILAATALLAAVSIGKALAEGNVAYKARQAELAAIPAGGTRPQLPAQSPYLTKFEITAIENYTAQKLSVETAASVKSGITSGLSYAEIAREMGISEAYVRRYAGVLSRATIDLDVASPTEE